MARPIAVEAADLASRSLYMINAGEPFLMASYGPNAEIFIDDI